MFTPKNIFRRALFDGLKPILSTYSEIFVVNDWRIGLVIGALTFINPNVGLCGVISLMVALALAHAIGLRYPVDWDSSIARNVILIGLSVGYLFRLDLNMLPLLVAASVGVFFLTIILKRILAPAQLPLLSLSFALMNIFLGMIAQGYDHLYQMGILHQAGGVFGPEQIPAFMRGFCNTVSYIVFINNFWVGAGISVLIMMHSRLLFLAMFASYGVGASLQVLKLGSWNTVFLNPEAYNFIYAGTLMSVVFLIPSMPSMVMGILTIALTNIFYDGLGQALKIFGLRPSALPFNIAVLGVVQGLIFFRSKWRNIYFGKTPEQSVERLQSLKVRFGFPDAAIELPFEGHWLVTQGFSGSETHLGPWRYALDFKKVTEDGAFHLGKGLELADYPSFGAEVLSPCSGYVVALENHHRDNDIGLLDEARNWGNFIILKSDAGIYMSICHLKQGSIKAKIGDYVTPRQVLAACGNSGYSAEPHLHLQVQLAPYFQSPTLPFRIASYIQESEVKYHSVPPVGAIVQPFERNRALEYALVWPAGRKFRFRAQKKGSPDQVKVYEIMACKDVVTGRSYLGDDDDNRLHFWNQDGVFYFYDYCGSSESLLAKMFVCLPRIPLTYSRQLGFTEYYPLDLAWGNGLRWWKQILRLLGVGSDPHGSYKLDPSGTVLTGELRFRGKLCTTEAVIDPTQGIKSLRIGDDHYSQCA